jgi:lipopolysaccharide heptosyltransferase II
MVPSAAIAHAGSQRSDPDAARPRRAGIGERRKLGHSLRERRYDRAYVLPNSFKSALVPFFAGIPHRTGWLGEMRYGLLNDARKLDKDAWPLMVERYVGLAYDKGVMRCAKDLPQPLLWPQLQVHEGENRRPVARLTSQPSARSSASAPAQSSARQNAGRTITTPSWRNS